MDSSNFSLSDLAAVNGNSNGMNNWMNNPFMYLIWLAYMGNGGFGLGNRNNGAVDATQNAEVMAQLNSLREQIQDNQNTNAIQSSVNDNASALNNINNGMGLGFASTTAGINSASMNNVIGQKDMASQMASCCCDIKSNILNQTNALQSQMASNHSADQLLSAQNQAQTISRVDQLANGVQTGFSQIGYQSEKNANAILQGQQAQTQTILNTLNAHWNDELQSKYQDAKLELSQLSQNATLIAALKTTSTT